jgi:hypothetical protein
MEKLTNDTKTRRKGSMLQGISSIKYFLVFAVLLVLPMMAIPTQAIAGVAQHHIIDQTDKGSNRLVYFADTRGRDTFIQVTNTTTRGINIHVQVFRVNAEFQTTCSQCNFNDMLTPMDTHVYNAKSMVTNSGPGLVGGEVECQMPDDNYGFVVISFDNYKDGQGDCGGGDAFNDQCIVKGGPIIGMFRIIDELGYEYRTNAAGKDVPSRASSHHRDGHQFPETLVDFNLANGNTLSDLVGITFIDSSPTVVTASPSIGTVFGGVLTDPILIYNENESAVSCDPLVFSCQVGNLDKGIDFSLPNSKAQANQVCTTSRLVPDTSGWLHMPFFGFACAPPFSAHGSTTCFQTPFFTGFKGLNNGAGTGGMDSWWIEKQDFHH